uniref:Endothelial cell surface expressed chemotaxis and apoptosis regulator n=1 Tax=Bos mutus grunniens TaxID=30521 RepID=A0A8C0AB57_BOSMU
MQNDGKEGIKGWERATRFSGQVGLHLAIWEKTRSGWVPSIWALFYGAGADVPSSGRSSDSMSGDTSHNVTSTSPNMSFRTTADSTVPPSPTSETVLTVAAFGVISFIAILVVVVIVLVSVVSLRFKCRKNKESEDPQKPGSSGLSESGSTANGEKESITLISMKNINMNNSKGCPSAEKVL